jgi:hypothetical protein
VRGGQKVLKRELENYSRKLIIQPDDNIYVIIKPYDSIYVIIQQIIPNYKGNVINQPDDTLILPPDWVIKLMLIYIMMVTCI